MHNPCERCNGNGLLEHQDPKDPKGVKTFTVCPDCDADGNESSSPLLEWIDPTLPFFVVLLIPNFLLWGGM